MKANTSKGSGGARKGAGRPALEVPTVQKKIRIPVPHAKVIDDRGNDWLRDVIAKAVAEPYTKPVTP